ncbi:major facilitator superfamily domain-containing protein 6-like isoform X2 [Metopolophium dirhodum]|uniref:major facilitator superfamily domain-containing protein 6-like isoform X2 n=1 Tax=Metopolophium dirhodum TaxID=44670 RepID=UPI0029904AFD|nr:major facilitator superfamily domain-containing protein 6-like isoform X2 [Metopolophium dirhodum]
MEISVTQCHRGRKGIAPINPFLPSIAKQRGIPVFVIGIIFTFMPIFNIVARPITGYITDRWRCRKQVFLGASLLNAFFTPLIHFTPDFNDNGHAEDLDIMTHWKFWIFLATITVRMLLWMVGDVLQDTICLEILGDDKKSYGRQRVWGAVGWGISTLLVGTCVDCYSVDKEHKNYLPAYLIAMAFLICHFIVASQLDNNQTCTSKNITKDVIKILSDVKVCSYLVWAVFAGIFTAYIWFYLFLYIEDLANIYHQERLPWIKTIQGFSVTVECCMGEIPVYIMTGYILKKIGHMTAFSVSFAMFSMRFFLYSIIKDPLWVLPVELTNGITFALAFVAGISYAAEVAPSGSAGTLQGLFGMAFHGIGVSLGSFMAGYTFEHMGSSASFELLSYVAFTTFLVQVSVSQLIMRMSRPIENGTAD